MTIQINGIKVDKNTTCARAHSNKESDILEIGMIFRHPKTKLAFVVIEIDVKTSHQTDLLLEQTGSWYKRIKDSKEAYDVLYDKLELVTDKEEIKLIKQAACYC